MGESWLRHWAIDPTPHNASADALITAPLVRSVARSRSHCMRPRRLPIPVHHRTGSYSQGQFLLSSLTDCMRAEGWHRACTSCNRPIATCV